jgi:hypothetical protein
MKKKESKLSLDDRKKQKLEKRRLYRLKRKEELKRGSNKKKIKKINSHSSMNIQSGNSNSGITTFLNKNSNSQDNPINIILADNVEISSEKSLHQILPVIDEIIQSKILIETDRLENFLINKFNKVENKTKGAKVIESIDLTAEEKKLRDQINNYSDEEVLKILASMVNKETMKIDFDKLIELAKTNQGLFARINNLAHEKLKESKKLSLDTQKTNSLVKSINLNSIKFPIEDSEIYKNPKLYGLSPEYLKKPEGSLCFIPDSVIAKILKIWDFLVSFKSKLNLSSDFSPEQLYTVLKFYSEAEIYLITEIFSSLLFLMGEHLNSFDLSDLLNNDDNDLALMKVIVNDSSMPKKFIYRKCWTEILRIFIVSFQFQEYSNDDIKGVAEKLKTCDSAKFNLMFTCEEKVAVLDFLINSIMDSDVLREQIKQDMEKRTELIKEKSGLQMELKNIESRKKEIERQEKFTQPRQKVEILTKKLQTLNEDNQRLTRNELHKMRKNLENQREEFRSVIKEAEDIDINKAKMEARIEKISNEIHEIPSTNNKLIGVDGLNNHYFFFPLLKDRIFIKKRLQSIKSDKKGKISFTWRQYTTEEEIFQLLDRLTEKGIREKNLFTKISKLKRKFKFEVTKQKDSSEMQVDHVLPAGISIDSMLSIRDEEAILKSALEWRNSVNIKKEAPINSLTNNVLCGNAYIIEDLNKRFLDLEEKITEYLHQDQKEWESFYVRQEFKAWLNMNERISEYAKILLLFNHRFEHPYKILTESQPKIIKDEDIEMDLETPHSIINHANGHILEPLLLNPHREIAPKARLWSRELEGLNQFFLDYIHRILNFPSLYFALFLFETVFNDLIRRRETYKKKGNVNLTSNIQNFDDDISSEKLGGSSHKNNKIDLDDFYFDEGIYEDKNNEKDRSTPDKENNYFSNKNGKKDFFNTSNYIELEGVTTRRGRNNFNSIIYNMPKPSTNKSKKKNIVKFLNLGLERQLYDL